jgi:hypothetical protein
MINVTTMADFPPTVKNNLINHYVDYTRHSNIADCIVKDFGIERTVTERGTSTLHFTDDQWTLFVLQWS